MNMKIFSKLDILPYHQNIYVLFIALISKMNHSFSITIKWKGET